MLAMADPSGLVRATAPGIAQRSHLTMKQTLKALETFESPDAQSRSMNDEGRKIKRVDGGYQIINYDKYRKFDYTAAERMKRHRERVTRIERNASASASASVSESVSKKEEKKARPADQKEVEAFCVSIGLLRTDGEAMWLGWQDAGFGKTKDWKAKVRRWKIHGYHPSQKQKRNGAHSEAHKPIDRSKIDLPDRFKSWASEKYEPRREEIMAWRTWADVPNSLRQDWWTHEKTKLPGQIGELI